MSSLLTVVKLNMWRSSGSSQLLCFWLLDLNLLCSSYCNLIFFPFSNFLEISSFHERSNFWYYWCLVVHSKFYAYWVINSFIINVSKIFLLKLKILLGLSNQILWYQYVSQIKRFWCNSYSHWFTPKNKLIAWCIKPDRVIHIMNHTIRITKKASCTLTSASMAWG
mgnify:CR=1 FL=1